MSGKRHFIRTHLWAACLFLLLNPGATWAGQLVGLSFPSATLGREYKIQVYLPDGYDKSSRHYPTLYLLHGSGGNERDWIEHGQLLGNMDQMIAKGEVPPMVVIMPGHPWGWWADGNSENGESAFIQDVIPFAERTFRLIKSREGRLLAGQSAGGYGTVNLILKHPDMFAAAAAFSPAVYTPLPPNDSSANSAPPFQKDGKFDPETWVRLDWPSWFQTYRQSGIVVPIYINSGDHDHLDIAYHAAILYQQFRQVQPKFTEFRVVDGDHEWAVWANTFPEALRFMAAYSRPPF